MSHQNQRAHNLETKHEPVSTDNAYHDQFQGASSASADIPTDEVAVEKAYVDQSMDGLLSALISDREDISLRIYQSEEERVRNLDRISQIMQARDNANPTEVAGRVSEPTVTSEEDAGRVSDPTREEISDDDSLDDSHVQFMCYERFECKTCTGTLICTLTTPHNEEHKHGCQKCTDVATEKRQVAFLMEICM